MLRSLRGEALRARAIETEVEFHATSQPPSVELGSVAKTSPEAETLEEPIDNQRRIFRSPDPAALNSGLVSSHSGAVNASPARKSSPINLPNRILRTPSRCLHNRRHNAVDPSGARLPPPETMCGLQIAFWPVPSNGIAVSHLKHDEERATCPAPWRADEGWENVKWAISSPYSPPHPCRPGHSQPLWTCLSGNGSPRRYPRRELQVISNHSHPPGRLSLYRLGLEVGQVRRPRT